MAFRPYFQWNGSIYTAQQALTFLNNQYPNAQYTQIMERIGKTIHWGFNYTNLPPAIQNNLQAIYFRLEDYNFPLNNIKLEEYRNDEDDRNYTRILISKANLAFDFADIISQDFQVQINQTGIAIYNVAGKTNLYLDPITYSPATITVTGTYTNNLFSSIYTADVAGGWGVCLNQGTYQYALSARIDIGNSTSAGTCSDTGKQIMFVSPATLQNDYFIKVVNGSLTLGSLSNATNKATTNGCAFQLSSTPANQRMIQGSTGATVYLYSCAFYSTRTGTTLYGLASGSRIYNCILGNYLEIYAGVSIDVFNLLAEGTSSSIFTSTTGTFDKVTFNDMSLGVAYFNYGYTNISVSNVYGRGVATTFKADARNTDADYLVNCDVDAWVVSWVSTGSLKVYRQYTFNLKVQNSTGSGIENATLSLLNNAGSEVFTDTLTNSIGQIDMQTISRGFYNQTGGNTLYDYAPFTLSISKEGYETYTQVFTPTEKIDWIITLEDTTTANNAALIWSLLFGALAFAVFFVWWVRR